MTCTIPIADSSFRAQSTTRQYSGIKFLPTCSIISILTNLSKAPFHSGFSRLSLKSVWWTVIRWERPASAILFLANVVWWMESVIVSIVQSGTLWAARMERDPHPVPVSRRRWISTRGGEGWRRIHLFPERDRLVVSSPSSRLLYDISALVIPQATTWGKSAHRNLRSCAASNDSRSFDPGRRISSS